MDLLIFMYTVLRWSVEVESSKLGFSISSNTEFNLFKQRINKIIFLLNKLKPELYFLHKLIVANYNNACL